jgi:hypothetical protein
MRMPPRFKAQGFISNDHLRTSHVIMAYDNANKCHIGLYSLLESRWYGV